MFSSSDHCFPVTIHIGTVKKASIAYTLKYIHKEKKVPLYKGDLRVPEFTMMSNNLGKKWSEDENIIKTFKGNITRNFVYTKDGYKISLPNYYKNIFLNESEKKQQRLYIDSEVKRVYQEEEMKHNNSNKDYDYATKLELQKVAEINKFIKRQKENDTL